MGWRPNLVPTGGKDLSGKSNVYNETQPMRRKQADEEYLRQKEQFMPKCSYEDFTKFKELRGQLAKCNHWLWMGTRKICCGEMMWPRSGGRGP